MDRKRTSDFSGSSRKQTCSFSIEQILKKDDTKDDKDDIKRSCCCSPQSPCSEDNCNQMSSKQRSPFRLYRPLNPYSICRHPIYPIPTNPTLHHDQHYDLCVPRSIPKYLALPPPALRGAQDTGHIQGSSPIGYNFGLFRYIGERDATASIGYSSKQTIDDDDHHDSKRKGGQVRFSHVQSVELERIFSIQKYISPQERKQLSRFLHLSERQVKTWFQNRRAKWRRIKMEAEMRRRMAHEKAVRQRFAKTEENRNELSYQSENEVTNNDIKVTNEKKIGCVL
eukprot:Seg164.7 transcript_id=Seg164.7/GoldUCD/mRNA.D3Y31 product="Hematopoietically-expressed homeobox protein HHEX" protein_id=Seg164.7/GoldUCD/D3Y31